MHKGDNGWELYEVKASTSIKDHHLYDLAYQWFVLKEAGLNIVKASLVYLNNKYKRNGNLSLTELFCIEDQTEHIIEFTDTIRGNLLSMLTMLESEEPAVDIGLQCDDPEECKYKGHCWKEIPTPSIFNLYRMNKAQKFDLYRRGILLYDDIPGDTKLTAIQQLQIASHSKQKEYIDRQYLQDFLDDLQYPLSFFDFESFQDAIPRYDNQSPYDQVPFQYSLHIVYSDGSIEHKEFLGDGFTDPRRQLAEQMLTDIPECGTILAYNQAFEKTRIKELANLFDDLHDSLLDINDRFIDLLHPFTKQGYYHPLFNGSFSIKSVLPAMLPDDPELDYKALDIQNGSMAMDEFANLYKINDTSKREDIRQALLAYCHLDTLAMVKIWERIRILV